MGWYTSNTLVHPDSFIASSCLTGPFLLFPICAWYMCARVGLFHKVSIGHLLIHLLCCGGRSICILMTVLYSVRRSIWYAFPKREIVRIDFEPRIKRTDWPIRAQLTVSSAGLETLYLAHCLTLSHHNPFPFAIFWLSRARKLLQEMCENWLCSYILRIQIYKYRILIRWPAESCRVDCGFRCCCLCYFYPCSGCFQ